MPSIAALSLSRLSGTPSPPSLMYIMAKGGDLQEVLPAQERLVEEWHVLELKMPHLSKRHGVCALREKTVKNK